MTRPSHDMRSLQKRALELGPIELMALLEWELRDRPRALQTARRIFEKAALALLACLERARRKR